MSPRQVMHLGERYQYLREVALLEVIYDALDKKQYPEVHSKSGACDPCGGSLYRTRTVTV